MYSRDSSAPRYVPVGEHTMRDTVCSSTYLVDLRALAVMAPSRRAPHACMGSVFSDRHEITHRYRLGLTWQRALSLLLRDALYESHTVLNQHSTCTTPDCIADVSKRDVHRCVLWGLYSCRQSLLLCIDTAPILILLLILDYYDKQTYSILYQVRKAFQYISG